jgi:hypothetical protein
LLLSKSVRNDFPFLRSSNSELNSTFDIRLVENRQNLVKMIRFILTVNKLSIITIGMRM